MADIVSFAVARYRMSLNKFCELMEREWKIYSVETPKGTSLHHSASIEASCGKIGQLFTVKRVSRPSGVCWNENYMRDFIWLI